MSDQERIAKLEIDVVQLRIETEVNKMAIGELKTTVTEIKQNTNKIVWLVGSALILALLNLIFKGGLV